MRFLQLLILTFCLLIEAYAQAPIDVSGHWVGTYTVLNTTHKLEIDLVQEGNQLSGYLYNRSMDELDSAKKRISGFVKEQFIEIKEVSFEYHTGLYCLSNLYLDYSVDGSIGKLDGKWKGDFSLKTCPPGSSGKIAVYRSVSVPRKTPKEPVLVDESPIIDQMGEGLINELRKREYYALIIGINEYQDSNVPTLDNPIADASQLYDVLTTSYSFKPEHVVFQKNPDRAAIIDALDALANQVTSRDNLLIFYAGHGIWDEQLNQGYWLPTDAARDSKSFWLSNSTLRDYLGGIPSKHTLLISDACFSGGILKERGMALSSKAMLELYKLPSRKAMTSGTLTTVPDQSVFIEYLIANLKRNKLPLLSAEQLFQDFKIAVIHNSPNGQVPQYGAISQAGDEGGDFIFLFEQ